MLSCLILSYLIVSYRIVSDMYSIEPRQTRVEMGHQIGDMLVSCSFAGIECGSK